jgi:hypothetical protein
MYDAPVIFASVVMVTIGIAYIIYMILKAVGLVERREFPNVSTDAYVTRANAEFDDNRTLLTKIEDFDVFKYSGSGIPMQSSTYTRDKSLPAPYSIIAQTTIDPNTVLNSTILPEDNAVETVESVLKTTDGDDLDTSITLSGINGSAEATLRESMVNSSFELRKSRK